MLDFVDANGEFYRDLLVITGEFTIGPHKAVRVFKISPYLFTPNWEFTYQLELLAKNYKIIDRRNGSV